MKQVIAFSKTPPTFSSDSFPDLIGNAVSIYIDRYSLESYKALSSSWYPYSSIIKSNNLYLAFSKLNSKNKKFIFDKMKSLDGIRTYKLVDRGADSVDGVTGTTYNEYYYRFSNLTFNVESGKKYFFSLYVDSNIANAGNIIRGDIKSYKGSAAKEHVVNRTTLACGGGVTTTMMLDNSYGDFDRVEFWTWDYPNQGSQSYNAKLDVMEIV